MFRCALLVLATLHAAAARNQVATPAKRPAKPKRRKAPELTLRQYALCGAVARTTAQLAVHPLNVAKTVLQSCDGGAPRGDRPYGFRRSGDRISSHAISSE